MSPAHRPKPTTSKASRASSRRYKKRFIGKRGSSLTDTSGRISPTGSLPCSSSQAPSASSAAPPSEPFKTARSAPSSILLAPEAPCLEQRLSAPQPNEGRSLKQPAPNAPGQIGVNPELEECSECTDMTVADIYGHGSYQRTILYCCVLSLVVYQCHGVAFKVIARRVDFWCRRPAVFQNFTDAEWKNVGIPHMPDGTLNRCNVFDDPLGARRKEVTCTAWEYDNSPRTIITTWNLVCHREWVLSFAAVMYIMGSVTVVPTMGMIADQVGRRPVACIAVGILLVVGLWTCFASDLILFVCARCAVSGCTGTIFVTIFTVLFEVTSTEYRTLYCIIAITAGILISSVIINVLAQFEMDWRLAQVIFMALTSLLVSTFYTIEESPRWLLSCCKFSRAEEVMLWAAKLNGESLENVRMKFNKVKCSMLLKDGTSSPLGVTPIYLFSCPVLRNRCDNILIFWFVVMLTFYGYDTSNILEEELVWTRVVITVFAGPLGAVSYYCMAQIGRKITLTLALGIVGVATAVLIFIYPNDLIVLANIVLLTARGATIIAVSVNYVYTAELFPTVLRTIGLSMAYACGQLGALVATVLSSKPNAVPGPIGVTVLAVSVLFAHLAILRLPETNSRPITNTLRELEASPEATSSVQFPVNVVSIALNETHGPTSNSGLEATEKRSAEDLSPAS